MARVEKGWKQGKLKIFHELYGEYYTKYEQSRNEDGKYVDDRGVYCNTYRMIDAALNSLEDNPDLYVVCALNERLSRDERMMRNIIARFDYEFEGKTVPEWLID